MDNQPAATATTDFYVDPDTGEVFTTPEHFIRRSKWVFAKTMPESPHEYTVCDKHNDGAKSTCMSRESFDWFVVHIRRHGYREKHKRSYYSYLHVTDDDGIEWRYWTMGAALDKTIILNRARVEEPNLDHLKGLFDDE